jgi:hypothetical protein
MPSLAKKSEVARFFLPSTKDAAEADKAWVDLEVGAVVAGDLVDIDDKTTKVGATIKLLVSRLRDWNFTDTVEGVETKIPINEESMRRMDMNDFGYLATKVNSDVQGLSDEQKKS